MIVFRVYFAVLILGKYLVQLRVKTFHVTESLNEWDA